MDNDSYGHVNNVTYYSYFDTVVNEHLIRDRRPRYRSVPEPSAWSSRPRAAFIDPCRFPTSSTPALRVTRIGNSSVNYEIGLFRAGDELPAATGHFVHVWVDRATQRPTAVPDRIRAALAPLLVVE